MLGRGSSSGTVVIGPRGDGFKLKQGKFRLDMRKKFFPVREAVAAPSLAVFKARLDTGAWSNLL